MSHEDFKSRMEKYLTEYKENLKIGNLSYTDIMYSALLGSYNDYVVRREKEHLEK